MIKSVSLLTRKAGLSHEEFVKHWLEVHAPLAHAVPGLRRYVQSHIVGERTRPDIPTTDVEVDGVAETWYDDLAAMERANASPEAKALHADGALFIGRIKSFITDEKGSFRGSEEASPSPPLGAEKVGVRWGRPAPDRGAAHLTLPIACALGPLPLPAQAGGEGQIP
jgi:uncharacterized protein (TIGR02118 family)